MEPAWDQPELKQAVRAYLPHVVRTAYACLKNRADAEDVAQEVFLTLLERPPQVRDGEHLKAWLLKVTANKCKNLLKSGWYQSRNELPEALPALDRAEDEVLSAVLALDPKYRLPLHLHYYEGYSIREIAHILGLPAATVGTRLSRGRALLKQELEADYGF